MSEGIEATTSAHAGRDSDGAKAAGALIKQARENLGMHIGALAVALKVPVRKLEALEIGELASLSGPVFVRALASSVCRHLKMDPTEVLALLPQVVSVPFSQPPELKTPFRVPGESSGQSAASQYLTMPVLAVILLLVGAMVLAFWPTFESQPDPEPAVVQNPTRAMSVEPIAEPASAPVSQSITNSVNTPSLAVSAAAQAPVSAVSAPARPASAPVVRVSAGAVVAGETSILQFKAKEESWVEVVDAKGDAVLRRTLQPGELANASGPLPLRVVVGRIDATEVSLRGRKLDMRTISKDNVGRFEVGP